MSDAWKELAERAISLVEDAIKDTNWGQPTFGPDYGEELRAEADRIASTRTPMDGEVGELVERWRGELHTFERLSKASCEQALDTLTVYRDKVERLREALEQVARCKSRAEAMTVARAALSATQPKDTPDA